MTKFTAKDFVDYVNDEFDSETLQLLKNVLDERLTFLRKMGDMANPRTVVQGYKLNKQDLQEIRMFTAKELRLKAAEILKMLGVPLSDENIQDMVNGLIAKIEKHKAGAVAEQTARVSMSRVEAIVREEVEAFLNPAPIVQEKKEDKRYIEFVTESLGQEVICMLQEIASNYDLDMSNIKYKTITKFTRDALIQIPPQDRKKFLQEVRDIKELCGNDEIIL